MHEHQDRSLGSPGRAGALAFALAPYGGVRMAAAGPAANAVPAAVPARLAPVLLSGHARTGRLRTVAVVFAAAAVGLAMLVVDQGARPAVDAAPRAAPASALPPGRAATSASAPVRLSGLVGGNLYTSEREAGAAPVVAADYIHAIAQHVQVGRIASRDRFDLIFVPGRAADGEATGGRLLYAALTHGGQTTRLMRWATDEGDQWFDASGAGPASDGFIMPVTGARLSSGFGPRFHPILGFNRMHRGVDLAAPWGTPIVAAADGVVRFAGERGGYGNFVQIAHGGGTGTGYGHMSAIAVHPGEAVQAGQVIGYVGSSGLSTGPHCHFEVYVGGVAVDPMSARFETMRRLGGRMLARFRAGMAQLMALPVSRRPLARG